MSKRLWISEDGNLVHPNAPRGGGGPGGFRSARIPLEADDIFTPIPNPHSPVGRLLAFDEGQKRRFRQQLSARVLSKVRLHGADLNRQIAKGAKQLIGKHLVGRGECTDLVEHVMKMAGAKTAYDFGDVATDTDYKWGTAVDANDAKPGDILQFRNYKVAVESQKEVTRVTRRRDGRLRTQIETITESSTQEREHHTAIVIANEGNGTVTVVEQNVTDLKTGKVAARIQQTTLYLKSQPRSTVPHAPIRNGTSEVTEKITTNIEVSGSVRAYRPVRDY